MTMREREFCWRCHGYRYGVALPMICEDRQRCELEMADPPVEPQPKAMFDYSELELDRRDRRFGMFLIMGAVVAIVLFALAFS